MTDAEARAYGRKLMRRSERWVRFWRSWWVPRIMWAGAFALIIWDAVRSTW